MRPLRRKQAPSRTSRDSLLDRPQGNLHTGTGKSKPDEGPSYIYSVQVPRGFFKKSSQKARPETHCSRNGKKGSEIIRNSKIFCLRYQPNLGRAPIDPSILTMQNFIEIMQWVPGIWEVNFTNKVLNT